MNAFAEALPVIWVALGVVLLLILNMKFKINGMLALLLAAIFVGVCEGLPWRLSGNRLKRAWAARWGIWR